MSQVSDTLVVTVDPGNPGQFFACCGLLELADRLGSGAEGWFRANGCEFVVDYRHAKSQDVLTTLTTCVLKNAMSKEQVRTMESLREIRKSNRDDEQESLKKSLDKLWRETPLILGLDEPFRLDWFVDTHSGGSRFKTWAGQQSVIDIARAMKTPVEQGHYSDVPVEQWLQYSHGSALTFNFDSDASVQASPLDVGFSLDPLGMSSTSRPLLELLAFVGLQRFRPLGASRANAYTYALWTQPLPPIVASAISNCSARIPNGIQFTFPLLYRTKYLKSFLPAKPNGDSQ